REQTCCFTGHRPEKLPWKYNETDARCIQLKHRLYDMIEIAYQQGMRHFICGMARGCDFYFAELVIQFKQSHLDVILEAAIPCQSQSNSWSQEHQERWRVLVRNCDIQKVLQENYTPDCMLRRNRYMVDHSALVIAVYDGKRGGTYHTLEYAMKQGIPILDTRPYQDEEDGQYKIECLF
ncbi:MAG: DUF1273 family protein, partial [Oscillospiraceae bacterium]|nr:DUF1273 family protein [Oscillospiraceae bacterium]